MLILGVHGNWWTESVDCLQSPQYHDSAAVLLDENGVIAAIEEERLNRIKHSNVFPRLAIHACLEKAGVSLRDVDRVVLPQQELHFQSEATVRAVRNSSYPRRTALEQAGFPFQRAFGVDVSQKLRFVPHHTAHLWSAYGTCPYDSALIVSWDGGGAAKDRGGYDYGMVATGRGNELQLLRTMASETESLGHFYVAMIHVLGYRLFDEYKIMGLAPYGDPERYSTLFQRLYTLEPEGRVAVLPQSQLFATLGSAGFFEDIRRKGEPFTQSHNDMAAGIQLALERMYLHILEHFSAHTGEKKLCLAGGVSLNCSANGKLARSGLFEEIFVQPASHDAGCALGAAIATLHEEGTPKRRKLTHVYLGAHAGTNEQILAGLRKWHDFVDVRREEDVVAETAKVLASGSVIGWVQGRSEFGPRALGNRSILADPRPAENKTRINAIVKKREAYRPFAPSVQKEQLRTFFDVPEGETDYSFMLFTAMVRPEHRASLGAITHIDGTARIQTVSQDQNARYWRLLEAFGKITGCPILLNTSFNTNVEPIVDSLDDAVTSFLTTDLDCLVIGECIVTRRAPRDEYPYASLRPALPVGRKLSRAWRASDGGEHVPAYSLDPTETSGETAYDPYLYREPVPISQPMHQMLAGCDGQQTFEALCERALGSLISQRVDLRQEIRRLWESRALTLLP